MTPDFSIVVPTYRRPEALRACLTAIAALEPSGPSHEVLVVDDGGTSVPDAVVEPFRERIALTVLRQRHAGPAAARNTGIRAARGRWIAFTDDDCAPEPRWLAGFAQRFTQLPDHGVGGRTINQFARSTFCTAQQLLVGYVSRVPRRGEGQASFFPSNNLALPADSLRALHGFDETFPFAAGEDRDLCNRWIASGRRLAEAPDAVVRHGHALGLGDFCRLHHRYGRGARHFHRKVAQRAGTRIRLEPAGFYTGLLLAPLGTAPAWRAPQLCAALVLSQVCHSTGWAAERWTERRATRRRA